MLTLIRGIPGSGKTSYALKHFPGALLLEGDQVHMMSDGSYQFKSTNTKTSLYLKTMFDAALLMGVKHVVITTAYPKADLIHALIEANKKHGDGQYRIAWMDYEDGDASGNKHDVPKEVVESMKANWERFPGESYIFRYKTGELKEVSFPPRWYIDKHPNDSYTL